VVTIADVARHAGVSTSTVSHVLNRTRKVNPTTAALVEQAIAIVGYTPNTIARALARSATGTAGIAISAISNPYFSDIICAIESECSGLGLMVFLADTQDDPEQELRVIRALHERRVDGIILAPSAGAGQGALAWIRERQIPCVLVDRLLSNEFDQIGIRNKHAMASLVSHLIDHGHSRIGFIGGQPGFTTTLERIAGYRAALQAHGLRPDDELIEGANRTVAAAAEAASRLMALPRPPTAIATGNNLATIGAMRALHWARIRVPNDIALVAFDDFEWADCFEPRLTTIAQPVEEIGRRAASLLSERIRLPDGGRRTIRLTPSLVIRNSCGCTGHG
jgi:LacI family transcriptional regulator